MRFLGTRRDYWRLLTRGAALLMVTLGIYRFWLTTDMRRFLWANTEIAGEALEYTGTPFELLIGFLVAIAMLIPLYAGFFVAALDLGLLGQISGMLGFAALSVLGQYAIYRARRYRLTRTVYRGLRFHQDGSAWALRSARHLLVDGDRVHARAGLSVAACQPRTLQDAPHLLRRPRRPFRRLRLRPAAARTADVAPGVRAAGACASAPSSGAWTGRRSPTRSAKAAATTDGAHRRRQPGASPA